SEQRPQLSSFKLHNLAPVLVSSGCCSLLNLAVQFVVCVKSVQLQSVCVKSVQLQSVCVKSVQLQSVCVKSVRLQSVCVKSVRLQSVCVKSVRLQSVCVKSLQSVCVKSVQLQSVCVKSVRLQSVSSKRAPPLVCHQFLSSSPSLCVDMTDCRWWIFSFELRFIFSTPHCVNTTFPLRAPLPCLYMFAATHA
uniref:Uncharacterized protein n=1 Tax=Xiphophorus maculatus TaxID=8083 RepID=A0A3B5PYR0_XIPMA